MRLRTIVPESSELDLDDAVDRERLAELYRPVPEHRVRVNMIASINGSSIGADGTSESLSNRVDRAILGVIRSQADAVVVGAASVRAEGYVVPRSAPLAIVSASGDLTGHRLQLRPGARVLLLVPDDRFGRVRPPAQGVDVIAVPSSGGRMSVPALLAVLASHGMHRVVCEGGPSLTAQFVAAGVVDEICLTTAPQVFLPGLPVMSGGTAASAAFRLQQFALDDSGFSYARWLRDEPVPRASR